MTFRLLATKFHIPPFRADWVSRTRLLDQLTCGLNENRKLTLVSAPAGYGKTTLITEWLHGISSGTFRIIWLSLDDADNDPERFIRYLLAAFQQVDPTINDKIQPWLNLPQLPPMAALLDELINCLTEFEIPILFTLDDYHVITNPQIHNALEYYLDHQPASVHIVITTREDPPLPLARLRARRQMTEIRARDLRFMLDEARQFLSHTLNRSLDEETLQALNERTEGWAVGLQLAGLALQNLTDPHNFVETFRGNHRYVLDYLAGEVIRLQGEEIRTFLTQTSILDRFNADACYALTGRKDSQAVIVQLEQVNLFIVPLDDERIWYRYHQLFSDYLRTLLTKAELTGLHKKASTWYEANNLMVEAVQHALASKDPDLTVDVVERALTDDMTWSGGNITLLLSWLDALPPQSLQSRPLLNLNASRILYLSGNFDLAEIHLAQTESTLRSLPVTAENEQMLALVSLYRGSIASVRGDSAKAIELTNIAQASLPRENHLAHARGFFTLGLAYEIAGQTSLAVENYMRSSAEARSAGVLFLSIHALCALAQVQIKQGRFHLAEQNCLTAIQLAEGVRLAPLGLAWSILGGIDLERNDLTSAEKLLMDGISLSRQGGLTDDIISGLALLARLRVYQGDQTSALAIMQEVKTIMHAYGIQRLDILAASYLARLQLYMRQKHMAVQWMTEYRSVRQTPPPEFEELTLARILLATGELDTVPSILQPILEKAGAAGRTHTYIETILLMALFYQAKQEMDFALYWLDKCLRLAAPEGNARIFLDEGEPLFALLPKARLSAPEFVDSLLGMRLSESRSPLEQLPDPLSKQETCILKLIVAGKSNAEIADDLVISIGTAKWHVHNVLQKLEVSNRPQAIVRARELGI